MANWNIGDILGDAGRTSSQSSSSSRPKDAGGSGGGSAPASGSSSRGKFNVAIAAGPNDGPPPLPDSPGATGLSDLYLEDLLLKTIYTEGRCRAIDLAHLLCLSFNVIEEPLDALKEKALVGVVGGGQQFGKQSMEFVIMDKGRAKVAEIMHRDNYVGPAPVPYEVYTRRVDMQSINRYHITPAQVERAFSKLVLDPKVPQMMGPAINSGRSIFLYGPPGNGKTALAQCITESIGGEVYVPRSIIMNGEIIKVFDALYHEEVKLSEAEALKIDRRWVKCGRPIVMVGGELTLETLDLIHEGTATYYEAPFQMKATNGVLFIDDFGRQKCEPQDLLNRWIVPLESRFDFLAFASGLKIRTPFDCLLVISTNLDPKQLVDDAFLRRIRYKIEIGDPTEERYRAIFDVFAKKNKLSYTPDIVDHLIENHYKPNGRPLRACQPRDLMEQFIDNIKFRGGEPRLTRAAIDQVCEFYFVDL
jgi:hypothetical protein